MRYPVVDLGNASWKGVNGGLVGSGSQYSTPNVMVELQRSDYAHQHTVIRRRRRWQRSPTMAQVRSPSLNGVTPLTAWRFGWVVFRAMD